MIRYLIIMCLIFPCLILKGQGEWKLRKDRDGIMIYTRMAEGSNLKEYRISAEFNCTVEKVYNFLMDIERRTEWAINCKGVDIIDSVARGIIYHTGYAVPWPLADRELILINESEISADRKEARLLTLASDYEYPLPEESVRIRKYREAVRLKEIKPGQTEYTTEGYADPGGKVPAWIVNMFLVDGTYTSLVRIRESVED